MPKVTAPRPHSFVHPDKTGDTALALRRALNDATDKNERLRSALERAKTILSNMALENEGAIFYRWPISHEPLRADARNLLPVIDRALSG